VIHIVQARFWVLLWFRHQQMPGSQHYDRCDSGVVFKGDKRTKRCVRTFTMQEIAQLYRSRSCRDRGQDAMVVNPVQNVRRGGWCGDSPLLLIGFNAVIWLSSRNGSLSGRSGTVVAAALQLPLRYIHTAIRRWNIIILRVRRCQCSGIVPFGRVVVHQRHGEIVNPCMAQTLFGAGNLLRTRCG
jgi:hypothetical protein